MTIAEDRQEIEYLRRLYAKATDALGRGTPEDIAEGRRIYNQIFTEDVVITTSNTGMDHTANGPGEWADFSQAALADFTDTQHLIGSQLVTLDGDEAFMESYLNGWHKNPDGTVWIFIGTYIDKVRRTEQGWKIYDMNLRLDSSGVVATQ